MKKIKIIALFLTTLIIASCSNNDDAPITSENNIDYFNFSKENQNIVVGTWKAYRTENNIEVLGNAADGTGVYGSFNKFGNIIRIGTIPASGAFGDRNNYQNFSSNYFNFSLASLDEANKRVTVTFSGKVYENEYNLTSPSNNITGSFSVKYTDVVPTNPGIETFAKINGIDFHSATGGLSSTGGASNLELYYHNGSQYRISVYINLNSTTAGSYNFTPSTLNNKVILSKYNTSTHNFDNFNCTGNLNISEKTTTFGYTYIVSTFNLSAVSPTGGPTIQVTNGTQKDFFQY